jgi:hypothetical protein
MAYEPWTNTEKEEYIKNRNPELIPLYIQLDIPINNPEERIKYLFKKIKPTIIDEEIFSNLAKNKKRHQILLLLEKEILKNY